MVNNLCTGIVTMRDDSGIDSVGSMNNETVILWYADGQNITRLCHAFAVQRVNYKEITYIRVTSQYSRARQHLQARCCCAPNDDIV